MLAVYVGDRTESDLLDILRYYRRDIRKPEIGRRLIDELVDSIGKLGVRQIGRRSDNLPVNYRRTTVEKHIIFYTINQPAGKLTVYHVRHGARKSLAPATHRRLASDAERHGHPLRPPRPSDN